MEPFSSAKGFTVSLSDLLAGVLKAKFSSLSDAESESAAELPRFA